jgi:hypothetical protein
MNHVTAMKLKEGDKVIFSGEGHKYLISGNEYKVIKGATLGDCNIRVCIFNKVWCEVHHNKVREIIYNPKPEPTKTPATASNRGRRLTTR